MTYGIEETASAFYGHSDWNDGAQYVVEAKIESNNWVFGTCATRAIVDGETWHSVNEILRDGIDEFIRRRNTDERRSYWRKETGHYDELSHMYSTYMKPLYICGVCGNEVTIQTRYCSCCGAKMIDINKKDGESE